jgi:hypothetical protein
VRLPAPQSVGSGSPTEHPRGQHHDAALATSDPRSSTVGHHAAAITGCARVQRTQQRPRLRTPSYTRPTRTDDVLAGASSRDDIWERIAQDLGLNGAPHVYQWTDDGLARWSNPIAAVRDALALTLCPHGGIVYKACGELELALRDKRGKPLTDEQRDAIEASSRTLTQVAEGLVAEELSLL